MALQLSDTAPDFNADTTEGPISFHDWIGDSWAVLFSHPRDFTPVCTTELGYMAKIKPDFDSRNVKVIGLSVDPVDNHEKWAADIEETQGTAPNYPMIADTDFNVSKLYGMLPADVSGDPTARTPADNQTLRNVFVVGPDKKIKLILVYPMTTGRNFDEVLRVIDSLQLTAKHKVATPVNWQQGDNVIIAGPVSDDEAKATYPDGWEPPRPNNRTVAATPSRQKEPATWELVLKRNPVERLKQEKAPLGIRDELPALIVMGYESVPEEDVVRLQWWGLYHDKPKVGTFMLRLKIPSGILPPAKLQAIGEVSNRYGRGDAELSTRQCIQLHWLRLEELPNVFADLDAAGITTAGGCGDTVRNITGCPVAGLDAHELFDCSGLVEQVAGFFYGNTDFTNLPRKHKYTIASCADRCNAPEINCVSLIGVVNDGREGFAVKVGGGLSSVPRIARDLGVFVPADEAIEILAAITHLWSEDLRYRVSRVKARLKFMVDDVGAEGMRERGEARLGRTIEDFELPTIDAQPANHVGVHAQKQEGLSYIGVPVRVGLATGDQLIPVADLVEPFGGDVRITRQQNFVVTGVPSERIDEIVARLEVIGFPLTTNN